MNRLVLAESLNIFCDDKHFQEACVHLEQKLERNISYLLCKHYISEIILQNVLNEKIQNTKYSGPNIPFYGKFQEIRPKINKLSFILRIKKEYTFVKRINL